MLSLNRSSQWTSSLKRLNWPMMIVFVVAILSVTSQFTSTLFLWDLKQRDLTNRPQNVSNAVGFRYDTWLHNNMTTFAWQGRNYWTSPISAAPAIAEWAEEPSEMLPNNSWVDTRPNLRAFLPVADP